MTAYIFSKTVTKTYNCPMLTILTFPKLPEAEADTSLDVVTVFTGIISSRLSESVCKGRHESITALGVLLDVEERSRILSESPVFGPRVPQSSGASRNWPPLITPGI